MGGAEPHCHRARLTGFALLHVQPLAAMALPGGACFVLLLVADAALKRLRGSSLVANRRAAADRKCTRVRLRRPTFRPSQMDALPWTRRRSVVAICAGRWYTRTVPRERTPAQVVCREGALMHTGDVTVCKPYGCSRLLVA